MNNKSVKLMFYRMIVNREMENKKYEDQINRDF